MTLKLRIKAIDLEKVGVPASRGQYKSRFHHKHWHFCNAKENLFHMTLTEFLWFDLLVQEVLK